MPQSLKYESNIAIIAKINNSRRIIAFYEDLKSDQNKNGHLYFLVLLRTNL